MFKTLSELNTHSADVRRMSQITEEKCQTTNRVLKIISHMKLQKKFYKVIDPSQFQIIATTMAEITYIIRPVIYCMTLRIYGRESWKPYIMSFVIDFLRMLFEINFRFTSKCQKEEFKYRNSTALLNYLMRNPFYARVLKGRVLDPFLSKIFGKNSWIKRILFYIIEIKCSVSTLM